MMNEYAVRTLFGASFLCILELVLPRSEISLVSRARAAIFWAVYIVITSCAFVISGRVLRNLNIVPLFAIDLSQWTSASNILIQLTFGTMAWIIVTQVTGFFYYWFHRAQHKSKLLWRFHSVHHSIEEMSALNSNHHFSEEILRIPFIAVPASFLVHFEQPSMPLLWMTLLAAQGMWEHSTTRLNFGWFRYVVPDNVFHRIHHSREKKHFDKNFGSGSALWDIVFGTVYYPEKNEWPDVGLSFQKEPKTVNEFLFRPFWRKKKKDKPVEIPALGSHV